MEKNKERILVTGGLGYIGSHTVAALYEQGYGPIIIDNLSNSSESVIKHLEALTGERIAYVNCDIRDTDKIKQVIKQYEPTAVMHFAALKSVRESMEKPLAYYSNNVEGTLSLLEAMDATGLKRIIFSSSATVYGAIDKPAQEDQPYGTALNPYGTTKIQCEQILKDVFEADNNWTVVILRYFNPIGAHPSGLIGENASQHSDSLMPHILAAANSKSIKLKIYGDDYPTPDGTCIRDYIHILDLAEGHITALKKDKDYHVYNLGSGTGYSVKEIVDTFQKINGIKVPSAATARRQGDAPSVVADVTKAAKELDWKARLNLEAMCQSAWDWHLRNSD